MKDRRGSALIISILLMAVIATASFGIARWALIEISSGQIQQANIKAYYLAEAGIEEGLLRWRYNHQVETPVGSRQYTINNASDIDARKWQISNLTSGNIEQATGSADLESLDQSQDHVALTIYNRVIAAVADTTDIRQDYSGIESYLGSSANVAAYKSARPDLYVKKDNKIIFGLNDDKIPQANRADDLDLTIRWDKVAAPGAGATSANWGSVQQQYGVLCPGGACLQGDVDKNGNINISDATRILNTVVSTPGYSMPTNPFDICLYDVNNSRAIDVGDATAIQREIIGLTPPITTNCVPKIGIEVRLYQKSDSAASGDKLLAKKVFSPVTNYIDGAEKIASSDQVVRITKIRSAISNTISGHPTYLTITPLGADIEIAAFGVSQNPWVRGKEFVDSVSHIESVGVSNGRTKGLEVKIDQNSGNVLGLFDYVLYQGGK